MALSKKMKKILAGFYELYYKYEEAYENGNRRSAMFYSEKFIDYCCTFQKELNFSDEQVKDWKQHLAQYKADVRKEQLPEDEPIGVRIHKEKLLQEYFDLVLKDDAKGSIKWN